MSLRYGYGTNGFANHRLQDALAVIADLGYVGVALTLDHHHLDPYGPGLARRVGALRARLDQLGLGLVIETGARYLLDPWHKHAPTLLDRDSGPRLDFLQRAVRIGADLGAEVVSCWAGVRPPEVPAGDAWDRMLHGCDQVVATARQAGTRLGFEPEPGMLVQTLDDWFRLRDALGAPECFGLTLDIGHCRCVEPAPVPDCVRRACRTWSTCRSMTCGGVCTSTWSSGPARSTSQPRCARSPTPATAGWSPSNCRGTPMPHRWWPANRWPS